MAGDKREANLFTVPDFGQKSKWLQELAVDPGADYFALHRNGMHCLENISRYSLANV